MRYWIIVTLNNNNRGRPPDRGRVDGYVDRSACPFTIPSRLLVLSCQTSLDLPGFAQLNTCQKFHSDDDYTLYSSGLLFVCILFYPCSSVTKLQTRYPDQTC